MKLTPFELAQERAFNFFANLTETSAIKKLVRQSEECQQAFGDQSLPHDIRAQAVQDARQINEIFQTMGNIRDNAGINA